MMSEGCSTQSVAARPRYRTRKTLGRLAPKVSKGAETFSGERQGGCHLKEHNPFGTSWEKASKLDVLSRHLGVAQGGERHAVDRAGVGPQMVEMPSRDEVTGFLVDG